MIKHILKDGSCVDSIAGMTIKADQFDALYRMMEKIGGDLRMINLYEHQKNALQETAGKTHVAFYHD